MASVLIGHPANPNACRCDHDEAVKQVGGSLPNDGAEYLTPGLWPESGWSHKDHPEGSATMREYQIAEIFVLGDEHRIQFICQLKHRIVRRARSQLTNREDFVAIPLERQNRALVRAFVDEKPQSATS